MTGLYLFTTVAQVAAITIVIVVVAALPFASPRRRL